MDIKSNIVSFFKDEEGLTVVEYVLGAALLVAAITAVFTQLEEGLKTSLSTTMSNLDAKNTTTP
ncbi:fimbrial protein [Vibrio sp. UCD-FRSSP16_10]|uniref:Flp family type IVb pilin n=1 Tax=unclassified Vibrio TaxID=2614977 RepID=UPI00080042D1|nr:MULTISPECIES: fimbrial protein [unclassified Vibrio]OBT06589.1 fimbrial protein [Vibrio sp. UCD-FRSSP16_30]OBT12286.1 fimbrial protein [Vibrio sp. UCD-FRSSP16_10]